MTNAAPNTRSKLPIVASALLILYVLTDIPSSSIFFRNIANVIDWIFLLVTVALAAILLAVYFKMEKLSPVVTVIFSLFALHRIYSVFVSIWSIAANLEYITPVKFIFTIFLCLLNLIPFVWFTVQSLGIWTNCKIRFLQKFWLIPAILTFIPGIVFVVSNLYYALATPDTATATIMQSQISLSLTSALIWSFAFALISKWMSMVYKASIQTEN